MNKKFLFLIFVNIFLITSSDSGQIDDNEDIFTVMDIKTSDDTGDLDDSIELANNKSIIKGFKYLAFKIIPASFRNKIYHIQEREIIKTAKKITPTQERKSNHSYIATVNIEYDHNKVIDILNKHGIRYKTNYSKDVLFIPIFFENELIARQDWRWKWLYLNGYHGLLKFKIFRRNTSVSLDNKYATLFEPYHIFDEIFNDYDVKNIAVVFA